MIDVSRNPKIDYSTAHDSEDYEGQPGLDAAVRSVAMAAVQIILLILLREKTQSELWQSQGNYLLIGNARSENFYRFRGPFDTFFQPLKGPRSDCPLCQTQVNAS